MSTTIDKFEGTYRFLSNFWPAKVMFEFKWYPSVEHAYQAAKSDDTAYREKVRLAPDAKAAKRLGRKAKLRPDWEQVKEVIMADLLVQKFERHTDLAALLLGTGDAELIEGNWWGDTYWGVCRGVGRNILGKMLMALRDELRKS